MRPAPTAVVHGLNGLRGTVLATSCPDDDALCQIAVKLEDGLIVVVPENQFILQSDGTYLLARDRGSLITQLQPGSMTFGGPTSEQKKPLNDEVVIPRIQEHLHIEKQQVQRTVRIEKTVQEREEVADLPLTKEEVHVERIPMNRLIDEPMTVREDGDVTIIPVVEEIMVVEKRLMLKEELRVTRRRSEVHEPQRVTLRTEQIDVIRGEEMKSA